MPLEQVAVPVESRPNQHATRTVDDFYEDLLAHAHALTRVTLKFRKGRTRGRYRPVANQYVIRTEADREPDMILSAVTELADDIEAKHGVCSFQTTCHVETGAGVKACPPLTWDLSERDENPELGEVRSMLSMVMRMVNTLTTTITRQYGDTEKLNGVICANATASAEDRAANVEGLRVKFEHARMQSEADAANASSAAELALVTDLGPKALAVMAAREARQAATEAAGGDKMASWKHAVRIAQQIQHREAVQEVLGETCTELLDSIAASKKRTEVEALFEEFKCEGERAEINMFQLLAVAPEIAPLLDMLV